jgi:ABC-type spermidine/putrescine transport system permease subunit II
MKNQRHREYGKIFMGIFVIAVLFLIIVPTILSVPMSFGDTEYLSFPTKGFTLKWYHQFLTDKDWIGPTLFSLQLALITTAVCLIIGTMASLAIVRGTFPGKRILHVFFLFPLMTPIIVTGVAIYDLFATFHLIGTLAGLVIAHSVISVPYVILVVTANLYRFDLSVDLAARNLGANAFQAFMYVTLPIIKPGIIASGIFCFIQSLDDLVLVLFLMGTTKMTLPLRMFSNIQFHISPIVAAASTVFIVAAAGTVIALSFTQTAGKRSPARREP